MGTTEPASSSRGSSHLLGEEVTLISSLHTPLLGKRLPRPFHALPQSTGLPTSVVENCSRTPSPAATREILELRSCCLLAASSASSGEHGSHGHSLLAGHSSLGTTGDRGGRGGRAGASHACSKVGSSAALSSRQLSAASLLQACLCMLGLFRAMVFYMSS